MGQDDLQTDLEERNSTQISIRKPRVLGKRGSLTAAPVKIDLVHIFG